MASHIGVNDLHGISVPEGGYAHESSIKKARPIVETKDDQGVTRFMDQMPHEEQTISVKGTGDADLSIVAAGNVAAGSIQIISATASHELGKRPEFEIEARKFVNDD
jgi:hypothetical protein